MKLELNLKVNQVVKFLILADLVFFGGWSFLAPVLPIFIVEKIAGATLVTVGASIGVFWLVRSLAQLPVGNILDKVKGEKDDFYALVASLVLAGITAFLFLAISKIWHLYFIQALHGAAFGVFVTSWRGIFSRHLDKGRDSFEWALGGTAVGLSIAAASLFGGVVANWLGFNALFILIGLFSFASVFLVMQIPEILLPRRTSKDTVSVEEDAHRPKGV